MEELAHAIRQHQAVLFVGSGGTKTEGGATWGELAADVARELGSPVQSDPQETFDDLCDYQGRRAEVYQTVRRRLSQVRASPGLARLLRLPWLAIYTTNYDTAIEDSYRAEGILYPKVVWAPERAIQFGIPGEITLFKLMGCRTVDMLTEGEMVLSSVDRVRHQRERGEMYAHLDALVSARTILAVGYSFEDRLLLDAVRQVRSLRVQSNLRVYALFRPDSTSPLIDQLGKLGAKVMRAELESFTEDLTKVVGAVGREEFVELRYNGKAVPFRLRQIREALHAFNVVTEKECRLSPPYEEFLRGKTTDVGAYEAGLQWQRDAIQVGRVILEKWIANRELPYLVMNFVGRPGSGRTVASTDLLHYAVTRFPVVGVRIPRRSPRLDELAASQLAVELKQAVPGPESPILAVLADEQSVLSDVLSFVHEVQPVGARVAVIRSSASEISSPLLNLPTVEIHDIQLTDSIASTEASSLTDYISRLPKHLRATRWTLEDLESAAQRDPSFIELMYRLVDPARRSIRDIVLESFAGLSDRARTVVQALLVPSSFGIGMPMTVLAKIVGVGFDVVIPLVRECDRIVLWEEDGTSMPFLKLYHRRVAEILMAVPANREEGINFLRKSVESANLFLGTEHQFVASLLVGSPTEGAPVDSLLESDQVLKLFATAHDRGASRLLLHHYGLRLRNLRRLDEAVRILEDALQVAENEFRPTERKEIVATTLAHARWLRLRETSPGYAEDDPRLRQIREELIEARVRSRWNPHSYVIEATILEDLAKRYTGARRMEIVAEALALLREGLNVSGGIETRLVEKLRDVKETAGAFTEADAKELLDRYGNGHGFFLLFERAREGPPSEAIRLLNLALRARVPCVPALRAAMEVELAKGAPDYPKAKRNSDYLFNYAAKEPRRVSLTWSDHLQRIVCLLGSGNGRLAVPHIAEVRRAAPKHVPQPYPYFLKEKGVRATFHGTVGEISSPTVGSIIDHDVPGFPSAIFFNPVRGKIPVSLRRGDRVNFNVAVGVYGVTGWDVTVR